MATFVYITVRDTSLFMWNVAFVRWLWIAIAHVWLIQGTPFVCYHSHSMGSGCTMNEIQCSLLLQYSRLCDFV